jgi:hypothetical protein
MRYFCSLVLFLLSSLVIASEEEIIEAVRNEMGRLDLGFEEINGVRDAVWNENRTALSISGIKGDETHLYVFIFRGPGDILPVKVRSITGESAFPKVGLPLSHYDRYDVESKLSGDLQSNDLWVDYTYRAWKDGQRYSVFLKPIGIKRDGSLDFSQY